MLEIGCETYIVCDVEEMLGIYCKPSVVALKLQSVDMMGQIFHDVHDFVISATDVIC